MSDIFTKITHDRGKPIFITANHVNTNNHKTIQFGSREMDRGQFKNKVII